MGYEVTIRAYCPTDDYNKVEGLLARLEEAKKAGLPGAGLFVLETSIESGDKVQLELAAKTDGQPVAAERKKAQRRLKLATENAQYLPAFSKQALKTRYSLGARIPDDNGGWKQALSIDGYHVGYVVCTSTQHNTWTWKRYTVKTLSGSYSGAASTTRGLVEPLVEMMLSGTRHGVAHELAKSLHKEFTQIRNGPAQ